MPQMDAPPALDDRPQFPTAMTAVQADLDRMFRATPMYDTLGIDLVSWGPGWARVALSPSPKLGNLAGSLHGGATFTLADAAFEVSCNSYGRLAVALETSCHYHAPAPLEGTLIADAWELSRGGRTASYRLQVSTEAGDVVASYLALAYRTSTMHLDADRFPAGWG